MEIILPVSSIIENSSYSHYPGTSLTANRTKSPNTNGIIELYTYSLMGE